ncbi:Putative C6 zinc finger domain-containing protein [[Torrubiella] hemipterigena]|uniref:Putative C6 zinc finger domain-containing protein n=1 Tax=[Torrubiella] hemipterigena TaxID=1531966 RepID=A0A0A1TE20_9HYPO|nr:Putative C6 zinc finger domain-containing protein [[Torrubiella] hemipterigena]
MDSPNHQQNDDDLSSPHPAKRRLMDGALDYPRRRATIACEVCRSRKSRCDGNRPKCKLCTELGADCVYREPGVKLDVGDKMILEQLSRIESMLQMNMAANSYTNTLGNHSQHKSEAMGSPARGQFVPEPDPANIWNSGITNISTMPKSHTNAMMHLLRWPIIRDLVSRPHDLNVLLQLEMERESLQSSSKTPSFDLSNNQAYIEAYFNKVNVWYACVNPYTWKSQYRTALSNGLREGPESCIVLLVLALGQASFSGSIANINQQEDTPGMQYFMAAWSLLPGMMTANNVLAAQCHLLAAAYMFYLVRPMEAWNLLCATSTKLQLLLMTPSTILPQQKELLERIYWNTLMFESDLLAELELPHSGVVQYEEKVGLPGGFDGNDDDHIGTDNLWYFLAEIALRRLLNRVSQLLYSKQSPSPTIASLEPIVNELDYQLTQWYESLPSALQFPFSSMPLEDQVLSVLRSRFYACRTIIYRPYIEHVLQNEHALRDPVVRDSCHKCLESCVRQLEQISEFQAGHMAYLWQGALSAASQSLLVMAASISKPLQPLLLNIAPSHMLDEILKSVVIELDRYAHLAPSLGLLAEIVREAEVARHSMLRSA